MRALVAACALWAGLVASSPARAEPPCQLDAVAIDGLWRTERAVVDREIGVRPGQVLTKAAVELAEVRLWNSNLFSQVTVSVRRPDVSPGAGPGCGSRCERLTRSLTPVASHLAFGSGSGPT